MPFAVPLGEEREAVSHCLCTKSILVLPFHREVTQGLCTIFSSCILT